MGEKQPRFVFESILYFRRIENVKQNTPNIVFDVFNILTSVAISQYFPIKITK